MNPVFVWKRLSLPLQIVVWLLAFYVAWNVIPNGYGKLADGSGFGIFESNNLPYWLFIIVGVIEVFGSLAMFIPKISFYGAFPLFVVMSSASYFNGWNTATIVYAVFALIIAILMRPGFFRKKPEITKISI